MFGLGRMSEEKIVQLTVDIEADIKGYNVDSAGKHIQQLLKGLLDYRTLAVEEYPAVPAVAKSANTLLEEWQKLLKALHKFGTLVKKQGEHSELVDAMREEHLEKVQGLRYALNGLFYSLHEAKKSKK